MLAVDDDGMDALGNGDGLIPLDPENRPHEVTGTEQVHHARRVFYALGEAQDAIERYPAPADRTEAWIAEHPLWPVHAGFPAPIDIGRASCRHRVSQTV